MTATPQVHRALCVPLGEEVAIKRTNLEGLGANLAAATKETALMRRFHHPNVLPLYTSFVAGHELWMVMPLLRAGSVLAIMREHFPKVSCSWRARSQEPRCTCSGRHLSPKGCARGCPLHTAALAVSHAHRSLECTSGLRCTTMLGMAPASTSHTAAVCSVNRSLLAGFMTALHMRTPARA